MGTQYFDGSGATGGQDYPVTDLLQMMGRASRPDKDESGQYVARTENKLAHLAQSLLQNLY